MKISSRTRFGYTEKEMADSFLELLQSPEGLPGIGTFDGVYREVTCQQGRPDFLTHRNKAGTQLPKFPESIGLVGASILTILKPRALRTFRYIVRHSEFSKGSIARSLRKLIATGHVERTETDAYRLGSATSQFQIELWSFELKLDNPKRAVFQAQQSRTYADRAIIIVPPGQEKNYDRYTATMKRWGIGLATFSQTSGVFRLFRRGRLSRAYSPQHHIYAISQLFSISS